MTIIPVQISAGSLYLTGLRAYLALMFVPCVVIICRRRDAGLPFDALLVMTALWSVLSILKVAPQSGLERAGSVSLDLLGGYVIARAFITDAQQFRATIVTIALCVATTLPFALIESLTGRAPVLAALDMMPMVSAPQLLDLPTRMGLDRAQTVFVHPIHYGLFCSSAAALLMLGCRDLSVVTRAIGLGLIATGCFLSLSSGAVLSFGLQLCLMIWAVLLAKIKRRWIILAVLCTLGYVAVALVADRSPYRVFLSQATFSAHNAYWRELIFEWGLHNLRTNPIFGVGSNDWVRPSYMKTNSMDNFWLYMAVKYGAPALILLALAWLGAITRIAFAPMKTASDADLRRAWVICFIGLSFTLATVHVWTTIYSYVFLLFGAGFWMLPTSRGAVGAKPARPTLTRGLAPRLSRVQP